MLGFGTVHWIVLGVLGLWLILSVLNQFEGVRRTPLEGVLNSFWVPRWTFFAPNPGDTDFRLLYRDLTEDGMSTPWHSVAVPDERTLVGAFWNPRRRRSKLLFDAVQMLNDGTAQADDQRAVMLSIPYLLLLNHVHAIPVGGSFQYRQFAIEEAHGYFPSRPARTVIRSAAARLEPLR